MFSNSTSLASIEIPESVTSIKSSAFANTALTEIKIPDNVTEIGGNAFDYYRYVYEYEPGKKAYWPCAGEWFGSLNKSNSGNARTLTPHDVAGFYWANSPASTGSAKAYCLYLKANGQDENNANVQAGSTLNTEQMEAQAGDRANACSVRCMKDTGNR